MKIVGFELEGWERSEFDRLSADHHVETTETPITGTVDKRFADAEIISTFIYSKLDEAALRQFDRLSLIATRSTGYDHIDMEYCRKNGVAVSTVPDYGLNTVAEHTFALIHAVSRHIPEAVERTRSGSFSLEGLRGFDLQGKTLGVIGTGGIGRHVIRIAKGYEMRVLAFDVKPDHDAAATIGFSYTDLDTLLGEADIVTLHVPGIEKTRNLIDEPQFDRMKNGVVLINTARGFVVNVQALLKALAQGKVAGAGLDVLPQEPVIREEAELLRSAYAGKGNLQTLLSDRMLATQPNVLITPHIAFNTKEATRRLLKSTIDNILSFVKGSPENIVGSR